jgi:CheY-like chemotaxis protein
MPDRAVAPHLLIVDDEPFPLLVAARLGPLAGAGRVSTSSDPAAAIAQALDPAQAVDLVLLDVEMPALDGYACLRLLAQGGFAGAVAMLAGAEDLGAVAQRALDAAGGAPLQVLPPLAKPLRREPLQAALAVLPGS